MRSSFSYSSSIMFNTTLLSLRTLKTHPESMRTVKMRNALFLNPNVPTCSFLKSHEFPFQKRSFSETSYKNEMNPSSSSKSSSSMKSRMSSKDQQFMHVKPENPAFFTGNPNYFTILKMANDFCRKMGIPILNKNQYDEKKSQTADNLSPDFSSDNEFHDEAKYNSKWMSTEDMEREHNMQLSRPSYKLLLSRFNTLLPYHDQDPLVKSFLSNFLKYGAAFNEVDRNENVLDDCGRSYTIASRKAARAQVWMIPGDGQVYVNGQPLAYYFEYKQDRINAIRPLVATDMLHKYNVWALVEQGGHTGQAEALGTAVARGLTIHEPELMSVLKPFAKIDARHHERKKINQRGARAKYMFTLR